MPREGQRGPAGERETTPSRGPETNPQLYPGPDYSFTLQAIMEMQRTLGELKQSVSTLTSQIDKHDTKLDEVSRKVYAAEIVLIVVGAILTILSGVVVWFINHAWNALSPLIKISIPH